VLPRKPCGVTDDEEFLIHRLAMQLLEPAQKEVSCLLAHAMWLSNVSVLLIWACALAGFTWKKGVVSNVPLQ
jgi:hypothetical protein